jgi:hypothetical protein
VAKRRDGGHGVGVVAQRRGACVYGAAVRAADGMVVRLATDWLTECAADNAAFRNIGPASRPLLDRPRTAAAAAPLGLRQAQRTRLRGASAPLQPVHFIRKPVVIRRARPADRLRSAAGRWAAGGKGGTAAAVASGLLTVEASCKAGDADASAARNPGVL